MKCPYCGGQEIRSISQNALFHLWMRVISEEMGCTVSEIKSHLKEIILGPVEVIEGESVNYMTSMMGKKELTEFMERIQAWACLEFNIILPFPEDEGYQQLLKRFKPKTQR